MTALTLVGVAPWLLVVWLVLRPAPSATLAPPAAGAAVVGPGWTVGPSGPWGVLERHEIRIEPPEGDITADLCDTRPAPWVFPDRTRAQVLELLDAAALPPALRARLGAAVRCDARTDKGCVIEPPVEALIEMAPAARSTIYGVLADYPENQWYLYGFRRRAEDEATWFQGANLSLETETVLRRLMWDHAGIAVFSDPAAACAQLPPGLPRARAIRALARTPALLVRLRVTPTTDVEPLIDYWGSAGSRDHVRTLLESLRRTPGGAALDVVHLLPPLVRNRLYHYPHPGDPAWHCHWTAANYFLATESDRFLDARLVREMMATEFREVPFAERRLGDVLTYVLGDRVIHSAIYIADDILFTKNGQRFSDPWILMSRQDVAALYAPDDEARVRVYRKK